MIGVDYNLFWTLNPAKIKPFIRAFELKEKTKVQNIDSLAWLIGSYVTHSICTAFGDGKVKYPEKPMGIANDETPDEEQARIEKESKEFMKNFSEKFNFN